jgi:hypothetical protein
MIDGVAGLAENSWKLSLQLLGREGIATFPDIDLLSNQMVHANPHSADNANRHCICIFFFQGA